MKILVIGRSYPRPSTGMLGSFEYEQAQALKAAGNEVQYAFCDTRSIFRIRRVEKISNTENGIVTNGLQLPIGRLPYPVFSKLKSRFFIQILQQVFEQYKPDVIHIHFPVITMTEDIWAYIRQQNAKIVITEHFTKVMRKKLNGHEKKLLMATVEGADAFLCVSEALKNSVLEITGTQKEIAVVPNMINSGFRYEPHASGKKKFIYVGRLYPVKRVDLVVEAFAAFRKTNPDTELHIVGNGPEGKAIQRIIQRENIADSVTMYGALERNKVNELLNQSDYFVTASECETFGVPIIESWFCGIPVISPDTIPICNYMNDQNAVVYQTGNAAALADAMRIAVQRDYDSQSIAEFARGTFSSQEIVKQLMHIYNKI